MVHPFTVLLQRLRGFRPTTWLLLLSLVYLTVVLSYINFAPFYDGAVFFRCIQMAVPAEPFSFLNFRCENHSTILYFLYLALPQYLAYDHVGLVYLANALLAIASCIALYALLTRIFRETYSAFERALLTGIYAFMPVFVVHLFHINVDFGAVCFFVIYLSLLLQGELWWAILPGTAALLSKETVLPIFAASVVLYLLLFHVRRGPPIEGHPRSWSVLVPLLFPLLPLGLYFGLLMLQQRGLYWGQGGVTRFLPEMFLNFSFTDKNFLGFLVNIFVINYQWLLTEILFFGLIQYLLQKLYLLRLPRFSAPNERAFTLFSILLLLCTTYVVTRFRPWNNARYVLLAYPLLVLNFAYAFRALFSAYRMRTVLLSVIFFAIFLSNFHTLDPLSRAFYGTFLFGKHELLDMQGHIATGTYRGRDELAYNLEFLQIHWVMQEMLQDVHPSQSTVFFIGSRGIFYFPYRVEDETYRPVAHLADSFPMTLFSNTAEMSPGKVAQYRQPFLYYISLAHLDNQPLEYLTQHYQLEEVRTYDHAGYQMQLFLFQRPLSTPPLYGV